MMKILITVPWDDEQLLKIKTAYPQIEFCTALRDAEALTAITDAEVVFGDVSRDVFLAGQNLRWIQCHGAGVNKLAAIAELVTSDVVVTNTRGAHAATIAEHFFGMLLGLTRQLPALYLAQHQKTWVKWSDWSNQVGTLPISIQGLTLGIVGLGNIGRAIAVRAAAFQMEVIAVDKFATPRPDYVAALWHIEALPELLQNSDIVVVTVPGTPETNHLIGYEQLSLMKPTAYFSMVSRGGIVDEAALATMLKAGRLAGAALDVFEHEPLADTSPLWDAPNLILTPHVAGKSAVTTAAATDIFVQNIGNYIAGTPLTNIVDKSLGF
jgi:phosphoglycerate dehydrogenase-like enzyme